jgi:hypothetical protein
MRIGIASLLFTVTSVAQEATITVAPELTNEILANPGMGWQTFHRTASQDKHLPDWIPSTIHYARWGWGELELEPGKLNVEFLDRVLAESRASGQGLAFRVPEGPEVRTELERFLRRLGYRLVLEELQHPEVARAGATLALSMRWRNTGSAPCYHPYRIACRLSKDTGRSVVLVGQTSVEGWLPGSIDLFTDEFFNTPGDLPPGAVQEVSEELVLPPDLPSGRYRLSIGVVDADEQPVVRLGIAGRDETGWYPLSHIAVER